MLKVMVVLLKRLVPEGCYNKTQSDTMITVIGLYRLHYPAEE